MMAISPIGEDSTIMPSDQVALAAHPIETQAVPHEPDPALGIIRDSELWRLCRARHNRHRFAVEVLLRWYREGVDVERRLPELSTYLGHVKVGDTYWYLSATPELLQWALERLEHSQPRGVSS